MKYGFLGAGNMGGAILRGALEKGIIEKNNVTALVKTRKSAELLKNELGINISNSIKELISFSDCVFLGVKPVIFDEILPEIARELLELNKNDMLFISMAAGITIEKLENFLGHDSKIIRIMPNTPVAVQEAMTSVSKNKNVTDEEMEKVIAFFNEIGCAKEVPEDMIHCVIGVSGSSPAYTYLYIDALAEAAVKNGMDKENALIFAAQSVLGAAKMVLSGKGSPKELCDNVCCKGGTTIEAVTRLKNNGFERLVEEGFQATVDKSIKMSTEK